MDHAAMNRCLHKLPSGRNCARKLPCLVHDHARQPRPRAADRYDMNPPPTSKYAPAPVKVIFRRKSTS